MLSLVTISPAEWLNYGINVILPALVALVTAKLAHPGLKAVILLALSAISGLLTSVLDASNNGVPFDWGHGLFAVLTGFGVAVLTHFGLLSPLSITGSSGVIASKVPAGLGGTSNGRHESRHEET